ncbi:twin-arginine translocase TatA/TatE family subunit [Candidatus Nanohalococcus occultus]|uniref:Sec-independent protein translocase subunit TatA/TatB n=1 Tax=Candidatus Nanohalococcus occultus TaxID=2978047 RepID=UPI00325F9E47
MPLLGPSELLLVAGAIVALVLGPKKLPELAGSLGESKKEFRKSMKEADEVTEALNSDEDES